MEEFMDNLKSLREKVYQYLKQGLNEGRLRQGAFLNLNAISSELGISRTPLRDALFQLESEGFVTIFPRRGVMVNRLGVDKVRFLYEIGGALDSAMSVRVGPKLGEEDLARMEFLNEQMKDAIEDQDFDRYYENNLAFHAVYLELSENRELLRMISLLRERLFEFPKSKTFDKEWETKAVGEHDEIIRLFRTGEFNRAAEYIRDVHWSYERQERHARKAYSD